MNIPIRIEKLAEKCAEHNAIAVQAEKEIEEWLENHGININEETYRDMFIDCCRLGNSPAEFIKYIKDLN